MYGQEWKKQGDGKDIDDRDHAEQGGQEADAQGFAVMGTQPLYLFSKRPAAAGGGVIDEHQCGIKGIKKNHGDLPQAGNKIDEERHDCYAYAEKGNFQPLKDIPAYSGDGKIVVDGKLFSGVQLFRGSAEKGITRGSEGISEEKGKIKGDYS